MNVIPARLHGLLDYGIVVLLLLAPRLLFPMSLGGGTARLCYALAAVHLTMTLLTDFPLGMGEVISLGVHGVVELLVSIALVVLPWIAPLFFEGAQWLFTAFGVLLFALWLFTDYSGPRAVSKTSMRGTEAAVSEGPDDAPSDEPEEQTEPAPEEQKTEGQKTPPTSAPEAGPAPPEEAVGDEPRSPQNG